MGAIVLKAIAVWLLLAVLAVANAGLRNALISPRIGEQGGHVLSTILLCFVIFVVAWAVIRWVGVAEAREAYFVGSLWLVLTVSFEFLAGHYVFGNPWETLLADYNLARGRVWVLVLLATFYAPRVALAVRRLRPPAT